MKLFVGLFVCTFYVNLFAYDYRNPQLLIQSSFNGGFNLPASTLFTDATPSINDKRQVGLTLGLIDGGEFSGIWTGNASGTGKISYYKNDLNKISNVILNNNGNYSFTVSREGEDLHFYQAILKNNQITYSDLLELEAFWDYTGFSQNVLVNGNQYFSAKNFRNNKGLYFYDGNSIKELEQENNKRSKEKISFLFGASIHSSGNIVYKARLGNKREWDESRPDQIILNKNGVKKVIAFDSDYDSKSKWLSFRNSASTNSSGNVSFVGKNKKGINQLVISDGLTEKVLATEGVELKTISYFSPIINNSNWVCFRGITLDGEHAVFIANKNNFKIVVKQFEEFQTPIGKRMFAYGKHVPFGGNISFNNQGDIILNTGLSADNRTKDMGKGIVLFLSK